MKEWVTGIVAASLLSCIAMALTPSGRVKPVVRLVCGLVCALTLLSPILSLDPERLAIGIAAYEQTAQTVMDEAEEESKMLERTYIEEECAAYILGKAAETGAAVSSAAVTAKWDDDSLVWYPWEAVLDGSYSESLAQIIEAELGIPEQRQNWSGDE